jgi:hypothetical protein
MLRMGETVQDSLRKALIDSHVAAVAIAVLFFVSAGEAVVALWEPAWRGISFLTTAVAIRDVPYASRATDFVTRMMLLTTLTNLLLSLANLAAAWLFSRWTYGAGPLSSLGHYRGKLSRKTHA